MAFKKYQIFIFDEKSGSRRTLHLRSCAVMLFLIFIGTLMAGNVYLGTHFIKTRFLKDELAQNQQEIDKKDADLLELVAELDSLREDIYRIRQFDNKLRTAFSENFQVSPEASVGGATEFNLATIPLHRQDLANKKIQSFITELKKEIQLEEITQQDLLLYMKEKADKLASTPSIWPVQGGFVTSKFGMRTSPFTGVRQLHKGIDIAASIGTPVVSPANGTIIFAGRDGAYGLSLEVDHGGGIVTRYAHLNKLHTKIGQKVSRNERIADVGNTGRSTGPHLHYEVVVNGVPTNPYAYIFQD